MFFFFSGRVFLISPDLKVDFWRFVGGFTIMVYETIKIYSENLQQIILKINRNFRIPPNLYLNQQHASAPSPYASSSVQQNFSKKQ
jgi:hypothetical protein